VKVSPTIDGSLSGLGSQNPFSPGSAPSSEAVAMIVSLQQRTFELEQTLRQMQERLNASPDENNRALQQLTDDFNNVFSSSEAGTLLLDRGLRIRKFNPALTRIFAVQVEDIGRRVDCIADQLEGRSEMLQQVEQVLRTGEGVETEVLSRAGRWFLTRSLPYLNSQRTIEGVVLTFTEISANKAMHSRFDLAIESSRLVWWEWDIEANHLSIPSSTWFVRSYEQTRPEPGSPLWLSLVHPDDVDRAEKSLGACLRGETPEWNCEHRFKTRNGSWLWVAVKAHVTEWSAEQRPLTMLGTTQDIDTRKRAEHALARDAALLARVEDAIICTNTHGLITYWNKGAEQLYGWTSTELLGRPLTDRLPTEGHPVFAPLLRGALEGKTLAGEFEDYRKDGSRVWIDAQWYPMRDDQGQVTGLMGVARDISARRREAEIHRALENQLLQSQKMETLGTLAGGIAHDFNNLLMIMLGHTEMASEMISHDERALGVLRNVRKAGMRATELVRRIMAFSRVSEQPRQAVVLNDLVSEALPLLRASLPTTIEIETKLEPGAHAVQGDPTQIQQVLFNLCVNAGHAMQEKGGRLIIKVAALTISKPPSVIVGNLNAGNYVCVSVADTGTGMTPEVIARAFEPFFTTKPMGNGTGLGLSIVHSIVTGHGGAVQIASKPRKGTVVSVFLPARETAHVGESPGKQLEEGLLVSSPQCAVENHDKVIAVVDDEESIAHLTKQALENYGFRAVAFTSPQSCLEYVLSKSHEVELIVTDQIMPKITGVELVARLRAKGILVPVIIASGIAQSVGEKERERLAPIDFLSKPFEFAQLLHAIGKLLPQAS
jgi:PAS domain S-box-containing protein